MLKYNIRSRQIVDMVNDINDNKLITSPFFQRNLVWRDIHKVDFIKTILMGLPFPEIFIAKGKLDVERMSSTSCIVDGQQRMTTIVQFIDNQFQVENQYYEDLDQEKKADFLKYEVAIVDLDISADAPLIKELFKRLNRTFYSLSAIEKIATEYASSELMLVSKLLAGEIDFTTQTEKDALSNDPNITADFQKWSQNKPFTKFRNLILESPVFSKYEVSRKVHLMFVVNIVGSILLGIYNRNLKKQLFDDYENNFHQKDEILDVLDMITKQIDKLRLKTSSVWYNKANLFSLIIALYGEKENLLVLDSGKFKKSLIDFEDNMPDDYRIAAKEGVNNRKERLLRNDYIKKLIKESTK